MPNSNFPSTSRSSDDLRALGDEGPADVTQIAEVLDGKVVAATRPTPDALAVKQALAVELGRSLGGATGRVGWSIFTDPQLRLQQNVVMPDLAGWRKARLPRPPIDNRFASVPDWICEVLTPASAVLDRTRKLRVYASQAVCWVWLIDPRHRTVEVLWLEGDEWVLAGAFGGDDRVRISPFDGIELDLGVLWRAGGASLPPGFATP